MVIKLVVKLVQVESKAIRYISTKHHQRSSEIKYLNPEEMEYELMHK
jgi:hypothetical protein